VAGKTRCWISAANTTSGDGHSPNRYAVLVPDDFHGGSDRSRPLPTRSTIVGGPQSFKRCTDWAAARRAVTKDTDRRVSRGAADGVNVVVPFFEDRYYTVRPNIAIPLPVNRMGPAIWMADWGCFPSFNP